ncbi:MAG: ABC transporter permease [Spirochaetales bacterium]
MRVRDGTLYIEEDLTRATVSALYREYARGGSANIATIDLSKVGRADNSGVAFLEHIRRLQTQPPEYYGANLKVQRSLELFSDARAAEIETPEREPWLARLGGVLWDGISAAGWLIQLSADITFATLTSPFDRKSRRRGSVADQCDRIGVQAVPIVGFLSLIIGVIVVLQSAAQLRRFGAGLFVVDLLAISITRETGPLFTAIIVAGRSGSAIAAQLATMRVTEELDALTVMALDPVKYVIVPMMLGMMLTIPLLTGLSMLVGIGGGLGIAALSLDLTGTAFLNRLFEILSGIDIFVGLAKSLFFGAAIVLTASYYGLTSSGGSEGVGRSTTKSVVASIFAVIVLNAIFSLLYLV